MIALQLKKIYFCKIKKDLEEKKLKMQWTPLGQDRGAKKIEKVLNPMTAVAETPKNIPITNEANPKSRLIKKNDVSFFFFRSANFFFIPLDI